MSKLESQIEKYQRHMEHLRARMQDDAQKLCASLADSDVSATSIDMRASALANSAAVLQSCETALHALKAARP